MSDEVGQKPIYSACTLCRKRTFVDLLDEKGVYDYCREISSAQTMIPRRFVKRQRKKNETAKTIRKVLDG